MSLDEMWAGGGAARQGGQWVEGAVWKGINLFSEKAGNGRNSNESSEGKEYDFYLFLNPFSFCLYSFSQEVCPRVRRTRLREQDTDQAETD